MVLHLINLQRKPCPYICVRKDCPSTKIWGKVVAEVVFVCAMDLLFLGAIFSVLIVLAERTEVLLFENKVELSL